MRNPGHPTTDLPRVFYKAMNNKLLTKFNKQFLIFGSNIHGQQKFKWMHTTEMFYLLETGGMETRKLPSGIWAAVTEWKRKCYAEVYGPRWVLTVWQPPEYDREEWFRVFKGAFPWPEKGEFHPVESTLLPVGSEPTEYLTHYTIFMLHRHLGMDYPDHLREIKEDVKRKATAEQSWWDDIVDDAVPAFGNIPGSKEHASFASTNPLNNIASANFSNKGAFHA